MQLATNEGKIITDNIIATGEVRSQWSLAQKVLTQLCYKILLNQMLYVNSPPFLTGKPKYLDKGFRFPV